jgi:hypothetical protein
MSGNQHLDAGYLVHNNHLVCNDCIVWGCCVFFNSLVNSKSIVDYQSGSSVKKPTPITSLCRLQIRVSCFYMNLNFGIQYLQMLDKCCWTKSSVSWSPVSCKKTYQTQDSKPMNFYERSNHVKSVTITLFQTQDNMLLWMRACWDNPLCG